MELKLIEKFNKQPEYITFKSFKLWEKIGPFPLEKLVSNGTIVLDDRYDIKEEKYPNSGGYYIGQISSEAPYNEQGLGRIEFTKGDMYEGESDNGVKNGFGRYIWSNGDYYQGNWNNGVPDGYGMQVYASDGYIQQGEWKNNKF